MIIGELVKKAVLLNAEYDKAKNVHGTYLMAAPMRSENEKIISTAVLTIEVRSGNLQGITVYDQTHSVSVRKKNVAGLDASASPVRSDQNDRSAVTRSTYSIADFLELAHSTHQSLLSENVLKHFGEERNKNGHYNGRMKFSRKGLDPAIDEELEHTRDAFELVRHTHRITAAEADQLAGKILKEANSSCAVYRRRLMGRVKLNNESKLGLKKVLNSIQNA